MNTSSKNVYLFENCKLNIFQNYENKYCYLTNAENVFFTINFKPAGKKWLRKTVKTGMVILTIYQL